MAGLVLNSTVVLRLNFCAKPNFHASISATSPSRETLLLRNPPIANPQPPFPEGFFCPLLPNPLHISLPKNKIMAENQTIRRNQALKEFDIKETLEGKQVTVTGK